MRSDIPRTVLWRRLDRPGHDACRLEFAGASWVLSGHAAFDHPSGPASLAYRVVAGLDWVTRVGRVTGWIGERVIDLTIQHERDGWRLDGRQTPGLERCVDLDLGFTPATNFLQLQRLDLDVGASADLTVAWIDADGDALTELRQVYRRKDATTYGYESPDHGYRADLTIGPAGFVATYPELWVAEG